MSEASLAIGLLTHSVNPRGGVVHSLSLAEALAAQGHDVTLFVPARPGEQLFRPAKCEVAYVPVKGPEHDIVSMVESRIDAYFMHLEALLRSRRFDILHAQDSISGNALATLRASGAIEHYARTVHHLDEFDDPRLTAYQLRAFVEADQLMCVSHLWCQHLNDVYGLHATQIQNGVDTVRFTPLASAQDNEVAVRLGLGNGPVVVSVGGIEARKNTVRLLEGFLEFRRTHVNAQLLIAGGASLLDHDEYSRTFHALALAAGLNEQTLKILGKVADDDMPSLLRLADVVAMPSIREGFGLVALEAIASGTAALVSRIAPFTEHLGEADCVFVDPFDPASITKGLSTALSFHADHASIPARFSWAASAARHAHLYRTLLTQPELN
jgi:glycosyltransferase-like protein